MQTLRFDTLAPATKTDNLVELFKLMAVQDPRLRPTWAARLPQLLSEKGFVDVEQDTKDAPPHLAFQFHECALMIPELIARKTKSERMTQQLNRIFSAAVEETNDGAYHACLRFSVIARKPQKEEER
jgi:hypothetical protein